MSRTNPLPRRLASLLLLGLLLCAGLLGAGLPSAGLAQDAGSTTDGGTPAEPQITLPDPLQPCECLDCLKQMRLSTLNQRKIYEDRQAVARKTLQDQIDRYQRDAAYRAALKAEGKIFFCELWSTVEDELDVIRDYLIPQSEKALYGNDRRCLPLTGGSTDPNTCKIDQDKLLLNMASAPCEQIHLAILAHELVHAKDCWSNKFKPTWTNTLGTSCKTAFTGRKTPTPAQVMGFLEATFETELHAHKIEAQVEALLRNELTKQCKPDDYSTDMARNFKDAANFLKRARKYEVKP